MFMRKYFQCLAFIGIAAACAYGGDSISVSTKSETAMQMIERIMAKAGISFDGEFRSQFLTAGATGAALDKSKRSNETAEFTSVDFDIKARPNTITQGRLVFRMQQDWRNFFSDISNPIFTRWLSIDGTLKGMFSYNAGDFLQKFTPLTLYMPDIDILYEPELFAQQRTVAKNELFLGNNMRPLQGLNLQLAAEVYPIFNALKVNVIGSRLRNVETDINDGNKPVAGIEAATMEKFVVGGNVDATFLKGVSVGGNFLNIFDNKRSYSGDSLSANKLAENNVVSDVRGGIDLAPMMNANNWSLSLSAEIAMSSDDSGHNDMVVRGTDTTFNLNKDAITGSAMRAALTAGYKIPDLFNVELDAAFINNTPEFRNELAQSPSFIPRRIMNVENDGMKSPVSYTLPLYSTFDALYNQVFKFAPSSKNPSWWYLEPFSKSSYNPVVLTRTDLKTYNYKYFQSQYLDPSVQLVMPFGPATPNRTGIDANVKLGFLKDQLEAKVLFSSLKEAEETIIPAVGSTPAKPLPKTAYSQAGGGAKAEFSKFFGWKYPINLSLGVVQSKATNDGIAGDTAYPAASISSNFLTGNFYFKFWKRMAFVAGVENITNDFTTSASFKQKQLLAAIGLEYKVAEGSSVTATYGQIDVKHEGKPSVIVSNQTTGNHNQELVNVFLRVMF
jgi:hypothetical protein